MAVFPFHFAFDRDLWVLQTGPALPKTCAALSVGSNLRDALSIRSPRVSLDFEEITASPRSLFALEVIDPAFVLRGQVQLLDDGEIALFLGSPWIQSPEEFERLGLRAVDFAVHDTMLENAWSQKARATAVSDAERVLEQLELQAAEKARLEQIERALEHDLNSSGDLRVRVDQHGRILELRCAKHLNRVPDPQDTLGRSLKDVLPILAEHVGPLLAKDRGATGAFQIQLQSGERRLFFDCRFAHALSGNALVVGTDVTERMHLEEELRRKALYDPLTLLPNRTLLHDRIDKARSSLKTGRRAGYLAVLLIDLDDFKSVNDELGHGAGDTLLCQLAERMTQTLRPSDTACRLGGDEFAVLLIDIGDPAQALEIAERIQRALTDPIVLNEVEIRPGCSTGLVVDDGSTVVEELFQQADLALYRAKDQGKGQVVMFHEEFQQRARHRLSMKRGLEGSLERDEFVLHYQPILDLETLELRGVETLVRWQHPERGLLSPGEFVEIAEESGFVVPLGAHIMRRALLQAQAWIELTGGQKIDVAVNLSRKQLGSADLLNTLASCLEESGIEPSAVTLEITEGLVMIDLDAALRELDRLRALGVRIAMDDFGQGYSSLSYLEKLPIDILKVDKAFVDRLADGGSSPLTEAVVSLGQALGLRVIAEGIEDPTQLESLREMGCDEAQGYLFARPMAPDELTALLSDALPRLPTFGPKVSND